jgi:PPOX class probable F420-dependent enzyme
MDLSAARYFNLATFRRSGAAVATPVWFARDGDAYYVFSEGRAGKVKRIRANGRARVAACDVRGRILGPWHEAHARLLNASDEIERAYRALRRRYGWQMWLLDTLAKMTGRYDRRALIAVELLDS